MNKQHDRTRILREMLADDANRLYVRFLERVYPKQLSGGRRTKSFLEFIDKQLADFERAEAASFGKATQGPSALESRHPERALSRPKKRGPEPPRAEQARSADETRSAEDAERARRRDRPAYSALTGSSESTPKRAGSKRRPSKPTPPGSGKGSARRQARGSDGVDATGASSIRRSGTSRRMGGSSRRERGGEVPPLPSNLPVEPREPPIAQQVAQQVAQILGRELSALGVLIERVHAAEPATAKQILVDLQRVVMDIDCANEAVARDDWFPAKSLLTALELSKRFYKGVYGHWFPEGAAAARPTLSEFHAAAEDFRGLLAEQLRFEHGTVLGDRLVAEEIGKFDAQKHENEVEGSLPKRIMPLSFRVEKGPPDGQAFAARVRPFDPTFLRDGGRS